MAFFQEYLDFLRNRRRHEKESLARKYRAIGPLLTKMEGLVAHTNTGRSPALQEYYQYWEKKVFDSLLKVCIQYEYYSILSKVELLKITPF